MSTDEEKAPLSNTRIIHIQRMATINALTDSEGGLLKNAGQSVSIHGAKEKHKLTSIERIFLQCDQDNSGSVGPFEFQKWLNRYGIEFLFLLRWLASIKCSMTTYQASRPAKNMLMTSSTCLTSKVSALSCFVFF